MRRWIKAVIAALGGLRCHGLNGINSFDSDIVSICITDSKQVKRTNELGYSKVISLFTVHRVKLQTINHCMHG